MVPCLQEACNMKARRISTEINKLQKRSKISSANRMELTAEDIGKLVEGGISTGPKTVRCDSLEMREKTKEG